MDTKRKLLGAAAFSLALAGGGVAGAVLGTPSLSGAQEDTTSTTTAADAEPADGTRPHPGHRGGARLETAAEALGMTTEELRTELEGGKSIAQVAEERDVDVQDVVDALVAEGTEHLEAAIAELPERVAEAVEREALPERRGPGGPGHGPRGEGDDAPADGKAPADAPAATTDS